MLQTQKPNNLPLKGVGGSLDEYILQHIDAEGDYLHALWRDTQLRLSYGQMASGHLQGRVLKMLIEMAKPQKVLELGTFSGYATLCMAEGLQEGAEIHTFEVFDENEDFLRKWFEGSQYKDKIHLHIGDALQLVPQMEGDWDFAFIDADKREYVAYYQMLLPLMSVVCSEIIFRRKLIIQDLSIASHLVMKSFMRESLQTKKQNRSTPLFITDLIARYKKNGHFKY